MAKYSIMLDMKDKEAVIVGGGKIAYRKLMRLVEAEAQVVVVSPTINEAIKRLWKDNKLQWKKKVFEATDIQTAYIVIAATNKQDVNASVAASVQKSQLVNIVDDRMKSNFYVPAVFTNSDLVISVSTNGVSPILAKQIRDEIAAQYQTEFTNYFRFLSVVRDQIKQLRISQATKNILLNQAIKKDKQQSIEAQRLFLERINHMKQSK